MHLNCICKFQQFSIYSKNDKRLRDAYIHFSSNSLEFEFFCIKRWFVLLEFMKANNIKSIFAADSDFLIYDNISTLSSNRLNQNYAGYCIVEQTDDDFMWLASGHFAYLTLDFLEDFYNFVLKTYLNNFAILQSKIDYNKKNNVKYGGISDMTLLYLFYKENKAKIINFLLPENNKVIDLDIGGSINYHPDEYLMQGRFKKIKFISQKPHGYINGSNTQIQFIGLHFQANAKFRMCNFYNGKLCKAYFRLKSFYYMNKTERIIKKVLNKTIKTEFKYNHF
jgi:hypothetical protein